MRKFFFFSLIILSSFQLLGQTTCIKITSWNIANLGGSQHDTIIAIIANTIKQTDILCIQEVIASYKGPQAVAKLLDELKRKGADWDCSISEPTTGNGTERYAYLWKKSSVKLLGKPWLEIALQDSINREPYLARFISNRDTILIASFHAVPKSKNPAYENAQLYILDSLYEKDHLLILGDFNSTTDNDGFNSLYKRELKPTLSNQKTTIKMEPHPETKERLANEYDNIFYEKDELTLIQSGAIDFTILYQPYLQAARKISDHIPVWGCYNVLYK